MQREEKRSAADFIRIYLKIRSNLFLFPLSQVSPVAPGDGAALVDKQKLIGDGVGEPQAVRREHYCDATRL